jgi:hypothetical protein
MTEDQQLKMGKALDRFTGTRGPGAGKKLQGGPGEDAFPGEFARLKLTVIRPAFEAIGNLLRERGHEYNLSEEPGGRISIHIVPAGVSKSIHPYDWFPTFSLFSTSHTKTIGLHGRNMRPNSEASSGLRGDYKPEQINKETVEKELMKFIGEIANW